jgi:ATP-dependent RNA helicase RhlE
VRSIDTFRQRPDKMREARRRSRCEYRLREILTDPVTVQIGATQPAATVSHAIYPVKQHLKSDLLEEILYRLQSDSVLVFTKTKYRAERVAQTLVRHGYAAASLQGNLTQSRRQAALDGFKDPNNFKFAVRLDLRPLVEKKKESRA